MNKEWHNKLMKICHELNIEYLIEDAYPDGKKIKFFCPKLPDAKQKRDIISIVPPHIIARDSDFIESPKSVTMHSIKMTLVECGVMTGVAVTKGRQLVINVNMPNPPEDHGIWAGITEILRKDGFFDSWKLITTEGERTIDMKLADTICKNKELRDTTIKEGDVIDLQILLNDPKMTWDKLMELL